MSDRNPTQKSWNEQERSIMILEAKGGSTDLVQKFLRQRNWDVTAISSSLQEGLQFAALCRPHYLFLSAELVPWECADLLNALKKAYHLIVFTPQLEAHSLKVTETAGARHTLVAAITGPAVERAISLYHSMPLTPLQPLERKAEPVSEKVEIQQMATACDHALQAVCNPKTDRAAQPLVQVGKLYCLPIQSASLSGFLMIASVEELSPLVTVKLQDHVVSFMRKHNPAFHVGTMQTLEFSEFKLDGLVESYAEFLRKAWHLGQEIAIAFFKLPKKETFPTMGLQEGYFPAQLKSLVRGEAIQFDMYVYLATNKKFIRYRRAGHVLDSTEIEKLQSSGVESVHVREDSLAGYEKYRATTYMKSLLQTAR